jgi:hypothetical protein
VPELHKSNYKEEIKKLKELAEKVTFDIKTHAGLKVIVKDFKNFRTEFYAFARKYTYFKFRNLDEFIEMKRNEYGIKSGSLSDPTISELIDNGVFSARELGLLLGISVRRVHVHAKAGRQQVIKVKPTSSEKNPYEMRQLMIETLEKCLYSNSIRDQNKLKAIELLSRLNDAALSEQIRDRYFTTEALVNFFLNTLIPEVNAANRQAIRDIAELALEGKDVSHLQVDVREIMKRFLPETDNLESKLREMGCYKDLDTRNN